MSAGMEADVHLPDGVVYILSWRYHDGSASGVLRAYSNRNRAEEDKDLLEAEQNGKEYALTDVPVYE